jgi:hypothetical protein
MSSDRDDRVDIIDLLISLLKDHEKKLDDLSYRLERLLEERDLTELAPREPQPVGIRVSAVLRSWTEFMRHCREASPVALDVDRDRLKVTAVAGGILYAYEEEIPTMEIRYQVDDEGRKRTSIEVSDIALALTALRGRLDCGLELEKRDMEVSLPEGGSVHNVVFYLNPYTAKVWLADQMGVDYSSIVLGELHTPEKS